jgi:DNA-binding transcriptional LysR family regulator
MAASPLSAAIRQLESELGVELFTRTTRHVALTEAGRRLLTDGASALQAVDTAFAHAAQAGRGVLGTLRLGSSPAARHEIRPALLARLRELHPGIEVDASEATTGNLCRELLSRRLDVAIGSAPTRSPGSRAARCCASRCTC